MQNKFGIPKAPLMSPSFTISGDKFLIGHNIYLLLVIT
jgi:hypothetical protein